MNLYHKQHYTTTTTTTIDDDEDQGRGPGFRTTTGTGTGTRTGTKTTTTTTAATVHGGNLAPPRIWPTLDYTDYTTTTTTTTTAAATTLQSTDAVHFQHGLSFVYHVDVFMFGFEQGFRGSPAIKTLNPKPETLKP